MILNKTKAIEKSKMKQFFKIKNDKNLFLPNLEVSKTHCEKAFDKKKYFSILNF